MKSTPRKTRPERREEIARAVLRIIGERGLTTLTTANLAAEVGVTSGALYRHFASLDEIMIETVRFGVEKIEATFPEPGSPPLDRLLQLAERRVRLLRGDRGLAWLLRSDQAYLVLPEQAAQSLRDIARRSRTFLLDALIDGAEDGTIRRDIEPEILLVTVLGTIHALIGSADPHPSHPGRKPPRFDRVLSGLVRLLQPSAGTKTGAGGPVKSNARQPSTKETRS
jgi:AcrR family transcriptional regulator